MLPGDRIIDEILWPGVLEAGDYRLSVTEDGAGRHGAAFVSTVHLAAVVRPSSPVARSVTGAAAPTVASNSFPGWILFGGLAGGSATAGMAISLVASARRRRAAHAGMVR
jgi:hypothetical protein